LSEEFEIKARAEAREFRASAVKQMEDVMFIIAAFGGIVLLGAVFALFRNLSSASEKRHNNSHIV
jgi:hypothetical protein